MTTATFSDAESLYRDGRFSEAVILLRRLLDDSPDDPGLRRALAMSLTSADRIPEAIGEFERIVERDPRQVDALYRLGCLHQHLGQHAKAAGVFHRLLAVEDYRDTRQRLASCEAATVPGIKPAAVAVPPAPQPVPPAPQPVPAAAQQEVLLPAVPYAPVTGMVVPGPMPLRKMIDQLSVADQGEEVFRTRQQVRYVLPHAVRLGTGAVGLAVLLTVAFVGVRLLPPDWKATIGKPPAALVTALRWGVPLLILAIVIRAIVLIARSVVEARLREIVFYQRGIDLASGLLNRDRLFVWYFQLAEEPRYTRSFTMLLTNTASLSLKYNDTASTVQQLQLTGIGSAAEVMQFRQYVQERRTAERALMRGFLT